MKQLLIVLSALFIFNGTYAQQDSVVISGRVTDFEGNPKVGAFIELKGANFGAESRFMTYVDENGYYSMKVLKGKYLSAASMILEEYPKYAKDLPKEKQGLEFWAWNVIAEEDLTLDVHYHRLEVYGVNIFRIQGAYPCYTIYCRPMSLSRYFEAEEKGDNIDEILCPEPEEMEVNIQINGEPVKVLMKQKVSEFVGDGFTYAYLMQVALPKKKSDKLYDLFKITMKDLTTGDQGEALYFKEKDQYIK